VISLSIENVVMAACSIVVYSSSSLSWLTATFIIQLSSSTVGSYDRRGRASTTDEWIVSAVCGALNVTAARKCPSSA